MSKVRVYQNNLGSTQVEHSCPHCTAKQNAVISGLGAPRTTDMVRVRTCSACKGVYKLKAKTEFTFTVTPLGEVGTIINVPGPTVYKAGGFCEVLGFVLVGGLIIYTVVAAVFQTIAWIF